MTSVDVDVCFNQDTATDNRSILEAYFTKYPHLRTIVLILKHFLAQVR
jgi:DNA polymerase sigma